VIEVEIKIQVTDEQRARLLVDATFIAEEVYTDIYYDSDDFALTTKGFWLRKRNEIFELKMPATESGGFNLNKNIPMFEVTNLDDIAQKLELDDCYKTSFIDALSNAGYKQLYKFKNTRQSYKKDGFNIDFDRADFGDLVYELCEIETMVESKEQTQNALDSLYAFIASYGISSQKAEGKLWYYIKRKNPAHCLALERVSER